MEYARLRWYLSVAAAVIGLLTLLKQGRRSGWI
jgi:hypothetical protein